MVSSARQAPVRSRRRRRTGGGRGGEGVRGGAQRHINVYKMLINVYECVKMYTQNERLTGHRAQNRPTYDNPMINL